MRYGPFVFLGLLAALSFSWLGMIATPQLQLGRAQPTNVPPANVIYPAAPSGLAAAGRDVYRANGCAYCHTQIVRQDGVRFDVLITSAGTNESAVIQAVRAERPDLAESDVRQRVQSSSASIKIFESKAAADAFQKVLTTAGAEVNFRVVPAGPDIQRAWGTRMTVAQDYLYQMPLMLGSTRLGPDLSNVGMRQPDPVWHLVHLPIPSCASTNRSCRVFLFEKRKRNRPSLPPCPFPATKRSFPPGKAKPWLHIS
ncbi:MAG: ribosomal protein L7/L12 [Verrucomicrobiota bacterium]